MLLGFLVVTERLFLQIDRKCDVGDSTHREGGTARSVDDRPHVPCAHHLLVVDGNILEERQQIDFLLIARAEQVVVRLAGDRKNRGAVELRVVQAVQKMYGAWS